MSKIKEAILDWHYGLSMEELFILTGIEALVIGIALAFLIVWIENKTNRD